jgi:Cdc6-like AAA superfamily ATPase
MEEHAKGNKVDIPPQSPTSRTMGFDPVRKRLATLNLDERTISIIGFTNEKLEIRQDALHDDTSNKENIFQQDEGNNIIWKKQIHNDALTSEDHLGFRPYVTAIADFLIDEETMPPLTLSIEGDWGSGKSFFLSLLKERLSNFDKQIVIEFNAWRHEKDKELWSSFAEHLIRSLGKHLNIIKRIWAYTKLTRVRFSWKDGKIDVIKLILAFIAVLFTALFIAILGLNSGWDVVDKIVFNLIKNHPPDSAKLPITIGGAAGYFTALFTLFKHFKKKFTGVLDIKLQKYLKHPDYASNTSFIEDFHKDFGKVIESFTEKEKERVYILIDDIDRCETPKAADLMQAINLMISDKPNVIFIIAMDREKVAASVAVKQEKLIPYILEQNNGKKEDVRSAMQLGYAFIEKFIQLPFHLPVPGNKELDQLIISLCGDQKTDNTKENSKRETEEIKEQVIDVKETPMESSKQGVNVSDASVIYNRVSNDSVIVHALVRGNAELFRYNPRRIKQFINEFRLTSYIATQLGIVSAGVDSKVTFAHIGKLITISMKWPSLISALQVNSSLLKELQQLANLQTELSSLATPIEGSFSEEAMKWSKNEELFNYLMLPINMGDSYIASSFEDDAIVELLRIAPFRRSPKFLIPNN